MARVTKFLATAAAVATVLGMASGANAAITASSTLTETYNQDVTTTALVACELNDAAARCTPGSGVTIVTNGLAFFQNGGGVGAVPPQDDTAFLTIPGGATATLTAVGQVIVGLSFFMGSPDAFNMVSFFSNGVQVGPTFTGGMFNGVTTNGDQSIGQRITFTGLAGLNINSVEFGSGSTAFELDRILVAAAPVPEPATWGMMILGMSMVGLGLRLRRRPVAVLA